MNELVRKAALRHYLATIVTVAESARKLEEQGIGTDEAIDQAIAAMPLDRVSTLLQILKQTASDLASTERGIEAYQSIGMPYGDMYSGLLKWIAEQPSEGREEGRVAEKCVERKVDQATDEAADRAADEGMFDRGEEQMNVDPDN